MYVARLLDLRAVLQHKSCFLFGPRQTGKSSLIRETLPEVPVYNLLDHRTWLDLNANPSRMREELEATGIAGCRGRHRRNPEIASPPG